MNGPTGSHHLTWTELACKDAARTPYPLAWRETRAVTLAAVFEAIRLACGDQPIVVLSGYRTASHNRAVGGARHSQHVQGRALDLKPPKGYTVESFYEQILLLARSTVPEIRGVAKYFSFVHVDIRPGTHLAIWNGSRPLAEMPV